MIFANEWSGEAAFIIGGGPSIKDFDFERLRGRRVIAVNNAGIEPDRAIWADVLFWADARWYQWNKDRISNHTGKYKITRQPMHISGVINLQYLPKRFSLDPAAVGGWCGGSSAINLAYHFGARVIILLGFDMTPGNWHDMHLKGHEPDQHRNKFIPVLETMAPQLLDLGVTVINTNPASALRCFPFATIEEILAMDDVALIEREKYLAVWERPEYRRVSPGMYEVERAKMIMGMTPGHSLIDFGSGPARATKWFQDYGMHVTAIDFAPNARETDVPFVEACLWDIPDTVEQADFGFCCDVMEHIPPLQINATVRTIARLSSKAAYFRIATRPDKMGPALIGKPLHVTVQGGEFWRREVEPHFKTVDVIESTSRDIILLARH